MLAGLLLAAMLPAAHGALIGRYAPVAKRRSPSTCPVTRVLLFGSYPAELQSNLSRERMAPDQPTVVDGHDFYLGTLYGKPVILAVAQQAPAAVTATTSVALSHFDCISAVVFEGTAGGGASQGLGDVTVPSQWTGDGGSSYMQVNAGALALAHRVAGEAQAHLLRSDVVDDGSCGCAGSGSSSSSSSSSSETVSVSRAPEVWVGGIGVTDGTGTDDTCSDTGGELEGCNACPPCPAQAAADLRADPGLAAELRHRSLGRRAVVARIGLVRSGGLVERAGLVRSGGVVARAGLVRSGGVVARAGLVRSGGVVARAGLVASGGVVERRGSQRPQATAPLNYVADDQQTTAAMAVAAAHKIPFIAFRGISDTESVGDAWPLEFAIYQQLAADNAAVMARIWIANWPA